MRRRVIVVLSLMLFSLADNSLARGSDKDKSAFISSSADIQESIPETCSEKGEAAKDRVSTGEKTDIAEFLFRIVNEGQDIIRSTTQDSKDAPYKGATIDVAELPGPACDRTGRKLKEVSPVAPDVKRP